MKLVLRGCDCRYELENIIRLFLPHERVDVTDDDPSPTELFVEASIRDEEEGAVAACRTVLGAFDERTERSVEREDALAPLWGKPEELALAELLYEQLCRLFDTKQPWGLITGVRPVKLLRRLAAVCGEDEACAYLQNTLACDPAKVAHARQTLHAENAVLALSHPSSCSLYISVPFCPSRCSYCSFVSQTTERSGHLIPDYVQALSREIAKTGEIIRQLALRVETIYIGGGTPTTLSAAQLDAVLEAVAQAVDISAVREYTVEAGRPDTVTTDKLHVIRDGGATRISINPQTLDDRVLAAIGRRHTTAQFYDAFSLARQVGGTQINTDLIAGLPTDTAAGFSKTLGGILALSPESVTVHTLSIKRASHLMIRDKGEYDAGGDTAAMIAEAGARLVPAGYHPYYLYRQSRCVGGQENTGWAKPGCDGLYNVYMMDETHTVFGCGAGAVTKLKAPGGEHLERVFNYKFPYEYVGRFEEMLRRKEQAVMFYERYAE
ncbi:MAG: coproporphyrinogen dehydrogenase HemZ [Clostridia bacterium]|nr:coproporphyrinogen dehydrogenase HemZ [Clostridia bacterium]